MFEFLTSASKKTIETQIDYFERAIKESKTQDTYYQERQILSSDSSSNDALRRPSEESIGKAREWISIQRKDYPDSKEILSLCKRWEELFDAYQKKMANERASIQAQGAAAREAIRQENGKGKVVRVAGYRENTGFDKKGGAVAATVSGGAETTVVTSAATGAVIPEATAAGRKPSETVVVPDASEASNSALEYNRGKLVEFKVRIDRVASGLARLNTVDGSKGVDNLTNLRALSTALDEVIKNPNETAVTKLQEAILVIVPDAKFTQGRNGGKPDGLFGPITMGLLEKAAGISETAAVATVAQAPAAAALGKKESGVFRMKDGTPVKLKDGTPVVGMRFEGGKVWVIGKNGQRVEMSALEGAAGSLKSAEALTENARKLEALADDAFVLLSALADHAVSNKWEAAPAFAKRVPEFAKFLTTLDVSNAEAAKAKIVAFVHGTLGESDLKKEFQEVFVAADSDDVRRKKVYDYVRGSFWPNRRNAGFDGASDSLAKKLAAKELTRMDASPESIAKFVSGLVDTDLRSRSAADLAKSILEAKGQVGFSGFLANTFKIEKPLASFIEDVRESNETLEKAYETKEAKKIFNSMTKPDGTPLTQDEIASYKVASRKAKLTEIVSSKALESYVKQKPETRNGNFDLDTFADIQGASTFGMADGTRKYVRNELWKDLAIEAAAIGVGAVTAGWGVAAVNSLAAMRWGNRAHEMMYVRVAAGTVGGGGGFEAGHGGIRSVVETAKNGWTPTSAYSWESLAQSMAFGGAFSAAGEILRKAGIAIDVTKKLSQQKAVLSMVVGADVTAALGTSYGISSWTGEKWTAQEALQAALMAAAFRSAIVGGEKMKFRATRDPGTGAPAIVPEGPAPQGGEPARVEVPETVTKAEVAQQRKLSADAIRAARKEISVLKDKIRQHSELIKSPDIEPSVKKNLENEIFQFENEIARLNREINGHSAFALEKNSGIDVPPAIDPVLAPEITDAKFKDFATALVGKLKKTGDKFEADGYSVVRNSDGYSVKIGDKTVVIDTPELVVKEITEQVFKPLSRVDFLSKFASDKLKERLSSLHRSDLGEGFRLTSENGVFGFEKKVGNGWEKVASKDVPETVQDKAGEMVFGNQVLAKAEGFMNRIAANPERLASEAEKKGFIAKFGEKSWIKAITTFEEKLAGQGAGGHDAHGHATAGRGKIASFFFGEHGSSWGQSLGWGAATQLIGPAWGIVSGEGIDRFKKMGQDEAVDFLVETLLFRYV